MNSNIVDRDLKYLWHPYTQMKDCEKMPPIPIERAEGLKLYGLDGNFYYDTISSWWCNVHGHGHPRIKTAIKDQLDKLEHVLFAGFTHEPAVRLAEKLAGIAPRGLEKVFYSDNGSTAVEVAMKMSFQFWNNIGQSGKTKFLSLDAAYHGDTIGAMSVSGVDLFNKKFEPLFLDTCKSPAPYCYRCPFGKKKGHCSLECLSVMDDILSRNSDQISAVILEPILMGAGGMIVYPVEYLKGVSILTKKHGVHLILDEVATGFGRTGKMFACEHADVQPDIMCLSKGITSGYLPLGVTMVTRDIFDAFYDDYDRLKTFYHGHTFTANPLSCAAACASLELFEEEGTLENTASINRELRSFLNDASGLRMAGDVRSVGAVGAIELVRDRRTKEPFGSAKEAGTVIYRLGLEKNLLLRPLGNVIYFFLPLCASSEELSDIFLRASGVFREAEDRVFAFSR